MTSGEIVASAFETPTETPELTLKPLASMSLFGVAQALTLMSSACTREFATYASTVGAMSAVTTAPPAATAMMPKMLYERLDEIGTDFAVIYPTAGLRLPRIKDDETRRASPQAFFRTEPPPEPPADHTLVSSSLEAPVARAATPSRLRYALLAAVVVALGLLWVATRTLR